MKYEDVITYIWQDRSDVALEFGQVNEKSHFIDIEYADWESNIEKTVRVFKDAHVWVYTHDSRGNKPSSPTQMIDANNVYSVDAFDSLMNIPDCRYRNTRETSARLVPFK